MVKGLLDAKEDVDETSLLQKSPFNYLRCVTENFDHFAVNQG